MENIKIIVLDTETANSLDDPLVYDCGWAVVDLAGNVYKTRSFVNADIFLDEKELMQSAYFADKIPQYIEEIANGERVLAHLRTIRNELLKDMEKYDAHIVSAHNARFDVLSLNTTERWQTKSKYRWFFPYGTEIWDSLMMARDTILKDPNYKAFCDENDYYTPTGKLKATAEVLYRYISGNENFEEAHTGLADVFIEKEIVAYCLKMKEDAKRVLYAGKEK